MEDGTSSGRWDEVLSFELGEDDESFELQLCDEHEMDEQTHADVVVGTTMEPIAIPPCRDVGSGSDDDDEALATARAAAVAEAAAAAQPMWHAMDVGGMIQVETRCAERPPTPPSGDAFDAISMFSLEREQVVGAEEQAVGAGDDSIGSSDDGDDDDGLSDDDGSCDEYDEHGTV